MSEDNCCLVCYNEIEELSKCTFDDCDHIFCMDCTYEMILDGESLQCPIDNKQIRSVSVYDTSLEETTIKNPKGILYTYLYNWVDDVLKEPLKSFKTSINVLELAIANENILEEKMRKLLEATEEGGQLRHNMILEDLKQSVDQMPETPEIKCEYLSDEILTQYYSMIYSSRFFNLDQSNLTDSQRLLEDFNNFQKELTSCVSQISDYLHSLKCLPRILGRRLDGMIKSGSDIKVTDVDMFHNLYKYLKCARTTLKYDLVSKIEPFLQSTLPVCESLMEIFIRSKWLPGGLSPREIE